MLISVALQKQMPWGLLYLQELFLKISQISQENTCVGVSFLSSIKKQNPTQVFSCEICKNF